MVTDRLDVKCERKKSRMTHTHMLNMFFVVRLYQVSLKLTQFTASSTQVP